jgi:hypothetical protein
MMRKLFVALLVGAVAVGLAAPAFAADLKFTGDYRFRFQFDKNLPCMTEQTATDCSGNDFQTRFRPRFDVETDGGVRGVLRLEIGDLRHGETAAVAKGGTGGAGTDGVNIETKWAYIDFPLPGTPLRLRGGLQGIFLSKALFLDDDFPGFSLYGKLGEINTNLWWVRANNATPVDAEGGDARDLVGVDLSFSPTRDLSLLGYVVYDHDTEIAAPSRTGYWVGVGAAGKAQNIRWDLDFVYGTKEISATADQKGYGVDGGIGMPLAGIDLELRGWYFTGHDGSAGDNDAFPVPYVGSGGHEPGTQVWGGGGAIDIDALADNPQNTWGIGVIARHTVNPNLKLTGNLHYIGTQEEGTAASPSPAGEGFIDGVDKIGVEAGVRVDYTIARGLVFTLTAGHLFLGDDTSVDGTTTYDDVTKVAGVVNYGF